MSWRAKWWCQKSVNARNEEKSYWVSYSILYVAWLHLVIRMGNNYTTWEGNALTYQIFFEKHIWVFIHVDYKASQDALSPYVDVIALKHGWQRHLVVMVVQELDCLLSVQNEFLLRVTKTHLKMISTVGRTEIIKSMEGFQTLTSSHQAFLLLWLK